MPKINVAAIRIDSVCLSFEIGSAKENQTHFEEEIRTKEQQLKIRDSLIEHKIWLIEYLAPTIDNIEKHVMASLNHRFNLQFQKW